MIIKLNDIRKKYNIAPKNIIHIGAHDGQEYKYYKDIGFENITWIEANPEISKRLEERFHKEKNIRVVNALVSDKDNQELVVILLITNNHLQF